MHTHPSDLIDWRTRAACLDELPDTFFPLGDGPAYAAQIADAKAVCRDCPVRTECLTWAMDTRLDYGVAGGMTARERAALRKRRQRKEARAGR